MVNLCGRHNQHIGGCAGLGYLEGNEEKGKILSPERPHTLYFCPPKIKKQKLECENFTNPHDKVSSGHYHLLTHSLFFIVSCYHLAKISLTSQLVSSIV